MLGTQAIGIVIKLEECAVIDDLAVVVTPHDVRHPARSQVCNVTGQ